MRFDDNLIIYEMLQVVFLIAHDPTILNPRITMMASNMAQRFYLDEAQRHTPNTMIKNL